MARLAILLVAAVVISTCPGYAKTWYVNPDGSGDALTISDGVYSSYPGDTVLVACGTYHEMEIPVFEGVTLISATGDPGCVTIDAQGLGRVLGTNYDADTTSKVVGFTITGGEKTSSGGGGIWCDRPIKIVNCVFRDNHTAQFGGAIACYQASPVITNCRFEGNVADNSGGAIDLFECSPEISQCTFVGNVAGSGGAISMHQASPEIAYCTFAGDSAEFYGAVLYCYNSSSAALAHCTIYGARTGFGATALYMAGSSTATLSNCIMVFTTSGKAVECAGGGAATLSCCDVYGNAGGDWVDCIAGQAGTNGNFTANPLFCDSPRGVFTVEECSPCLPGHHPSGYDCGGFVGALGADCGCGAATEPATWGAIKAIFR